MNREKFSNMIQYELCKRRWSYRRAQQELGVDKATFTRLKNQKNIDLEPFLTLCYFLTKVCGKSWKEIME